MQTKEENLSMEEIYENYFSIVYNYVFYRLLHRANTEDIVSLVFMKVFQYRQRYDVERGTLKTWILRITENTLNDFYRKQRPTMSLDHVENGLSSTLSINFDEQYEQICSPDRQALLNALRELPERDHMFIYYRYYLNITNREIARRMGMKENTVSAVLSRARHKLRGILEKEI